MYAKQLINPNGTLVAEVIILRLWTADTYSWLMHRLSANMESLLPTFVLYAVSEQASRFERLGIVFMKVPAPAPDNWHFQCGPTRSEDAQIDAQGFWENYESPDCKARLVRVALNLDAADIIEAEYTNIPPLKDIPLP